MRETWCQLRDMRLFQAAELAAWSSGTKGRSACWVSRPTCSLPIAKPTAREAAPPVRPFVCRCVPYALFCRSAYPPRPLYTTMPSDNKAAHSVQQLRAVIFRNGGAVSTLGVARPCPWSAVCKKESRVGTCVVLNATRANGESSSTIVRYARRSVSYACDADDCTGNTRELSRGSAERLRPYFGQKKK